jgi:ParB family chromosome partitioning protein
MSEKPKRMSTIDDTGKIIPPPSIETIAVSKLVSFKNHMFDTYEGERLDKLADSIRETGLQNPIIVRSTEDGNYEILSGHNRVKAVKLLGWNIIPTINKGKLDDEKAERIVIESNLNQQSFGDWNYSQQIRVIRLYSKHLRENSQQGKRSDLEESGTSVHGEQKSADGTKPKRLTARDKISKQLGISSAVFERYRSIAKLDEEMMDAICELLDEKRLGFMSAFRLSQLKPGELATTVAVLKASPELKLKGANVKALHDRSRANSDGELTEEAISEALLTDGTQKVTG